MMTKGSIRMGRKETGFDGGHKARDWIWNHTCRGHRSDMKNSDLVTCFNEEKSDPSRWEAKK